MKILYYIAIAIASLPLMAAERLEIMVPSGSYVSFMRNTVTPEFNKLYPEVNLVVSNDEQLDTRMAAGDNPNVYIGVFGYQPAKLAKLGKLAYLDKFPGFAELNERIDPHFLRENFGRTYYIPWNATTQMMIYNKELFAEAGLDPERPPATWDEFLLAAEKISALPLAQTVAKSTARYSGMMCCHSAVGTGICWHPCITTLIRASISC